MRRLDLPGRPQTELIEKFVKIDSAILRQLDHGRDPIRVCDFDHVGQPQQFRMIRF